MKRWSSSVDFIWWWRHNIIVNEEKSATWHPWDNQGPLIRRGKKVFDPHLLSFFLFLLLSVFFVCVNAICWAGRRRRRLRKMALFISLSAPKRKEGKSRGRCLSCCYTFKSPKQRCEQQRGHGGLWGDLNCLSLLIILKALLRQVSFCFVPCLSAEI